MLVQLLLRLLPMDRYGQKRYCTHTSSNGAAQASMNCRLHLHNSPLQRTNDNEVRTIPRTFQFRSFSTAQFANEGITRETAFVSPNQPLSWIGGAQDRCIAMGLSPDEYTEIM
jgi:hypothetical protein